MEKASVWLVGTACELWFLSSHSCGFSSSRELASESGPRAMYEEEEKEVNRGHLLNSQHVIFEPFSWSKEVILPAQIQRMRKYILPLVRRMAKILPKNVNMGLGGIIEPIKKKSTLIPKTKKNVDS